ncbi:MAG: GNAT family N-acetyltransferase [Candidatus Helarchaeota archaeon]
MFRILELDKTEIDKIEYLMRDLCFLRSQKYDKKRFREGIERRIKNKYDKVFVCKHLEEDQIIAMVIADFDPETKIGYIKSVIVDKKYRGLYIGENLMQAVLEYLEDMKAVNIKINIDELETKAYKLYSKLGFTPELREESKVKTMKIILE